MSAAPPSAAASAAAAAGCWTSWSTSGRRVTIPIPRGRKLRPTMFSRTELLPDDCAPMTTICGRSSGDCPIAAKTSCSLFTTGIRFSCGWGETWGSICEGNDFDALEAAAGSTAPGAVVGREQRWVPRRPPSGLVSPSRRLSQHRLLEQWRPSGSQRVGSCQGGWSGRSGWRCLPAHSPSSRWGVRPPLTPCRGGAAAAGPLVTRCE